MCSFLSCARTHARTHISSRCHTIPPRTACEKLTVDFVNGNASTLRDRRQREFFPVLYFVGFAVRFNLRYNRARDLDDGRAGK